MSKPDGPSGRSYGIIAGAETEQHHHEGVEVDMDDFGDLSVPTESATTSHQDMQRTREELINNFTLSKTVPSSGGALSTPTPSSKDGSGEASAAAGDVITIYEDDRAGLLKSGGDAGAELDALEDGSPVGSLRGNYRFETSRLWTSCGCFGGVLRKLPLLEDLCEAFGPRAVGGVTNVYFLVKGIVTHLSQAIMLPLFQHVFKASQGDYQNYSNVALMAWSVKPAIGVMSDAVPIAGFHKRSYMFLAAFVSALASLSVVISSADSVGAGDAEKRKVGSAWAAGCFFLVNLGCATMDLLTESKYSELMVSKPETGSSLVSWAWGCAMIGGAIAAVMEGPMADAGTGTIRAVLIVAICLLVVSMYPVVKNWFDERRSADKDRLRAVLSSNKKVVFYGGCMAVLAILLAFVALFYGRKAQLVMVVFNAIFLSALSYFCLPPIIAKANIFMFLKEALYIQIGGPLDYFFTAGPKCVPGGPGFSYTYYQTFTSIVGYVTGFIGVSLFHKFFSTRSFRMVFLCTTIVKIVSSMFDIVMVERWNIKAGIPDKLFYFLGDAIINSACSMIDFMPAVVLVSKLCPKGLESTMYALLAGFSNFGQTVSRSIGYYLATEVIVVKLDDSCDEAAAALGTDATSAPCDCDYSKLSTLIFIAHFAVPLLAIPLIFALVPKKKLTEPLLEEHTANSTEPSPKGDDDMSSD